MQPDPIQTTDAKRSERPIIVEASELALNGGAATVESGPAGRLTQKARMNVTRPAYA